MFSKEDLEIIFDVFVNRFLPANDKEETLKKKMKLLQEQMKISTETNSKLQDLDQEIRKLYEVEDDKEKEEI